MATDRRRAVQADQILADAESHTTFSDWGGTATFEPEFRVLFAAMCHSVTHEAKLHARGLRGAELRLRAIAEARLEFIESRKRLPAIAAERIARPILILGLPRSGSSFLYSLLSQDPSNRKTETWEMMLPAPPPAAHSYASDRRIARAQAIYDAMGLSDPETYALHPFGARLPDESHIMMELMGLSENLPAAWRMPGYNKVRNRIDMRLGYEFQRMVLQMLQHHYRGERWVLKNPGDLFYLDHLLAIYPDARIIQTHRDPCKVIPSVAALLLAMRRAGSDESYSGERIAEGNLLAFATGLRQAIEFRRQPAMQGRFHDVHFRQLIREPLATVRAIYEHFDTELTSEALAGMASWLASEDTHAAGARFSLEQFGLTEARVDQAFDFYIDQYDIERERGAGRARPGTPS